MKDKTKDIIDAIFIILLTIFIIIVIFWSLMCIEFFPWAQILIQENKVPLFCDILK